MGADSLATDCHFQEGEQLHAGVHYYGGEAQNEVEDVVEQTDFISPTIGERLKVKKFRILA